MGKITVKVEVDISAEVDEFIYSQLAHELGDEAIKHAKIVETTYVSDNTKSITASLDIGPECDIKKKVVIR